MRVRVAKMDIKSKFHFFTWDCFVYVIWYASENFDVILFLSLVAIFDGMKIAKILLHVEVHVQVRFLNLFIDLKSTGTYQALLFY